MPPTSRWIRSILWHAAKSKSCQYVLMLLELETPNLREIVDANVGKTERGECFNLHYNKCLNPNRVHKVASYYSVF